MLSPYHSQHSSYKASLSHGRSIYFSSKNYISDVELSPAIADLRSSFSAPTLQFYRSTVVLTDIQRLQRHLLRLRQLKYISSAFYGQVF